MSKKSKSTINELKRSVIEAFYNSISKANILEKNYYDIKSKNIIDDNFNNAYKKVLEVYSQEEFTKTTNEIFKEISSNQSNPILSVGVKTILSNLKFKIKPEDRCILVFLVKKYNMTQVIQNLVKTVSTNVSKVDYLNFKPYISINDIKFIKIDKAVTSIEIHYTISIDSKSSFTYNLISTTSCFISSKNLISNKEKLRLISLAILAIHKEIKSYIISSSIPNKERFRLNNLKEVDSILKYGMLDNLLNILVLYKFILIDVINGEENEVTLFNLIKDTTLKIEICHNNIEINKYFGLDRSIKVIIDTSNNTTKEVINIY